MADLPRGFRGQAYLLSDEIIDYLHGEFEAICQSPIEVAFRRLRTCVATLAWRYVLPVVGTG